MVRGHPLVEQAQAILCRLADAPPAAEAATAAIAEVERSCDKQPLAIGIGGALPERTELLNFLCGSHVLDPHARVRGSAAVRITRGATTAFRAERADGTIEAHPLPSDRAEDLAALRERAEAARGELAHQQQAIVPREPTRVPAPPKPPWWAIWSWIWLWLARWRKRPEPEPEIEAEPVARPTDPKIVAVREQAEEAASDATTLEALVRLARTRYFDTLRTLASGAPGVVEVAITLVESPLPEGIEIIELAGTSRAGAELDAVLLVRDGQLFTPGSPPQPLGDFATALGALYALASEARALTIARRIQSKITVAMRSLAESIERKEATFRERIERLERLQIADPDGFARTQLDDVRTEITASVTAIVEHASVHMGSELAALQQEWIAWAGDAANMDALKTNVAKIELEWGSRPLRIAEEVEVLVNGGLGGCARDLYPKVIAPLLDRGLGKEHGKLKAAPELPPVPLLPSLKLEPAKLEKGSWLAGLFRSFDAQRAKVRERVHERIERLREMADSELLDAEPRLNEVIRTTLAGLLATAIGQQSEQVEAALKTEYAAVTRERAAMAPLVAVAESVRAETGRLGDMVGEVERHQPAVAVTAAAAETASLSR
jgi:hypothetical protein